MAWLRHFGLELGDSVAEPTPLCLDNQGCIFLAVNPAIDRRTKHIDIRYHYIRYVIEEGTLRLIYCPTGDMTADVLTKALPSPKVKHFAAALGLVAV